MFWSCKEILDTRNKWRKCIDARQERENTCFKGGDARHKYRIALDNYEMLWCEYRYALYGCAKLPLDPNTIA
jgi:hypothetical protein